MTDGVQFGRKPKLRAHQRREALKRLEAGEITREIALKRLAHHDLAARAACDRRLTNEPGGSRFRLNQTFYLSVVSDVAADGESLVPQRGHFLGGRTYSLFIRIGEHDRSARFGESLRRCEAQTGSGACDKSNLAFEGYVHSGTLILRAVVNEDAFQTHP